MTDEHDSLVGKTVKLPGIDDLVTVLSVHTCSEEGCAKPVVVVRPAAADRPYPVHVEGYRRANEQPPAQLETPPQASDRKAGGGKHAVQ